jgi:cyanophycinase
VTRTKLRWLGLLLPLLILPTCEGEDRRPSSVGDETAVARKGEVGRLVIIGGGLRSENEPVYQAVLDGRWGEGPLCVLPTASGTPSSAMEGYVDAFDALGGPGTAEGILLTVDNRDEAASVETANRLRRCSGFFFTGGIQSRIVDVFLPGGEPSASYHALWERFQAGAVVSGSSAGAAVMSDPMIAGGSSGGALRRGIQSNSEGDGVWLAMGLGFLGSAMVDQHFLARGRWARLFVGVMGSEEDSLGFGIDENTALVVEGDSARVVGESGVVFLDARFAVREHGGNGGYGVRMYLLGAGDVVEMDSGNVRWGDGKVQIPEGEEHYDAPDADLFGSWSLQGVLLELATAPESRLTFRQQGHFLEFRKEPGFKAMAWDGPGVQGRASGLFLGPFVLSVWRE